MNLVINTYILDTWNVNYIINEEFIMRFLAFCIIPLFFTCAVKAQTAVLYNYEGSFDDATFSVEDAILGEGYVCLLYTSPSPRDRTRSRMPSSA